jgi:hypothetical protein
MRFIPKKSGVRPILMIRCCSFLRVNWKKIFGSRIPFHKLYQNTSKDTVFTILTYTVSILPYGELFMRNLVHAYWTASHALWTLYIHIFPWFSQLIPQTRSDKITVFWDLMPCSLVANEICGLLDYYAASCGNCLLTFRNNAAVSSSRVKSPRSPRMFAHTVSTKAATV